MNISEVYNELDKVTDSQSNWKLDDLIDVAMQAHNVTKTTKYNILCDILCALYVAKSIPAEEIDDMLLDAENFIKLEDYEDSVHEQ